MARFGFSPGSRHARKDRVEQAKKEAEAEKSRRRNFGFLKNADKKPSTTTLSKTREHAKELALAWDEPLDTPTSFSSGHILLQTNEPFDPFGHGTSTSAETPSFQFSFPGKRTVTNGSGSLLDHHFTAAASPEPTASTLDTFDTASVGSAYDMDFLPSKSSNPFPPASSSSAQKPKKQSLDQFVERTRSPGPWTNNDVSAARSMPTLPANSSMQSSFAKQSTSTSTAAARRKIRSQMRHSSNNSATSSVVDDASCHSGTDTPPESPARSARNGTPGSGAKNRLTAYQRPQGASFHSVASSVGNNSNQSSSNRSASEVNLFDAQNPNGGFTFDAFGLDPAQVEKEVNDAMHALAGQGLPGFSAFFNHDTDGDFSSQGWDSPATSRRSSPAPSDSETDGFVDGFRISPTPNRSANYSPASSELSLSSPATRQRVQTHAMETITPPRWENSPIQGSRDLFGDPMSNPWKEDPWGSDSGADSDFGGTQSEIVTSFFPAQPQFAASFPDSKSDIGISAYQKSVSFHKDVRKPPQKHTSNVDDESSEDSAIMQENIAREYALEFVQRVSPRHSQQVMSGGLVKHGHQSASTHDVSKGDPFGFVGKFDSRHGDVQEEMFNAEFGFPVSASDFSNDYSGSGDFRASSPSRSIQEDLRSRFDEHDDQGGRFQPPKPALQARSGSQAPQNPPSQFATVRTQYDDSRRSFRGTGVPDTDGSDSRFAQKPPSSYGKLRNSYEAAKSRLSMDRPDPVSIQSSALNDFVPSRSKNEETESFSSRVEEKKEEDIRSPRHDGTVNSRKSEWQPWDNKSSQAMSPQLSQATPKWKQTSQGSQHAALAGVEMLTPDIVEARRQEKRKSRVEELRQANQQTSGVPKIGNNFEGSISASKQRANECQVERSSFVSLRERLKPTSSLKAKSEVGTDYTSSFSANVVDRLRQESPRAGGVSDTKSDSGSSPFVASGKFKKTDGNLSESASFHSGGVNVESPSTRARRSFLPHSGPSDATSVPSPKALEPKAESLPAERKLTYREKRELELKKEQEVGKAKLETEKNEEPKKDVAALIRQRIAANKQKNAISPSADTGSSKVTQFRSDLQPIIVPGGLSPRQNTQGEKNGNQQPSPTDAYEQPRYPPRVESSDAPTSVRIPHLASDIRRTQDVDPGGSAHRRDFLTSSGARNIAHSTSSSKPVNVGSSNAKSPTGQPSQNGREVTDLGDARYATSNRLEALLSKKKEEPQDFSVHSTTSTVPKPVNKPAFQPPDDGAAGKNDVKAMLSGLLGARLNPFASLPAPKKEDDADAIMELKSFESKHSPERNASQNPEPARPPSSVTNGQRPALKDDPKYERYFRMLKVGMPMEVVKHAMQKDGTDPSVMDGDHNLPVGLPLKDDPLYTKYFKMLKMGMPLPQVKHSMQRDGLNPDVMDQDHNLPAASSEKRSSDEPLQKDTKRRARLHWKTLQKVNLNSLWSKIEKEPEVTNIDFDEDEFEELFQADLTPSVKSPKGIGATRRKGAAVRVIDAKRANNGGIILARVKMSHDEMADVVDRIDGDALTAEQIENIIEYLPTKEERIQLEKYMLEGGQDAAEKFDGLCECEKFMVSMMTVKHAKRKVTALLFKLQFISCLQSIAEDTQMIDDACDELKHSTRLRQLLGIVLQFGNRLNTAGKTRQSKAGAFTLDSLLKLSQAKAFDKKTTFLHYVVMIVHRNNEILLNFTDDLPTCMRADKIYWDQCLQDLEEVENQLENVRRISLYEARARKHNLRKKETKDDDDDSIGNLELSLEQEVEALRATPTGLFTLSAIKQVSALRDKVESTRKKFVRVLEYFGEDKDSMQPHELFHIFCVFGRDFNKAKEEAFASMKKKQREERKQAGRNQQQMAANGMRGKPPSVPERKTLRASNLQPNMSRVINDLRSPAKQPQHRPPPAIPHKDNRSHPASDVPDLMRSPRTPANVQSQQQHDYRRGDAELSRVSHAPSAIPYSYRQHDPQSAIPGGPAPRGMQGTAQFHDSPPSPYPPSHPLPAQATSAAESLRQKARNRGQRAQTFAGRTTPVASNTSTTESRSPRSSPKSSPEDGKGSQNESSMDSAVALSSRASMRHRRMQAIKRVNAARTSQPRNDWGSSSQVSTY